MKVKDSKIAGYQAPAVNKAFQVLKVVAESRKEIGLSEVAQKLDYSKSTTHGLIHALLNVGALDQNPQRKKFSLGPTIVELAFQSWNYLRVREQAQPILDALRDQIDESVFLGVLSRSRGIIMATAESTKPLKITSPPGVSIPLLAGAVGKVFLAAFDNPEALKLIREYGLRRFTERSITNERDYLAELDHVREQGYALDNEEYMPGVKAVAVNLGNHRGLPLALWVVGFAGSMAEKAMPRIIEGILNSAHKLRTLLDNGP